MNFLLDENIRFPNEYMEACNVLSVRQISMCGSKDIDIRKEALKLGLVIVTQDQKFVLHSMRINVPIIWKYRGYWYLAKGSFQLLDNPFDEVGKYCKNNDTIVLP